MKKKHATVRFRVCTLSAAIAFAALPAHAQENDSLSMEQRMQRLEQRQAEYERELAQRDARIRELEDQLATKPTAPPENAPFAASPPAPAPVIATPPPTPSAPTTATPDFTPAVAGSDEANESPFGLFAPGKGFTVAKTDWGELQLSLFTYLRYLNQEGLDDTYIDHFGDVKNVDIRNDFQVNKVFLYTKGWFLDPRFTYNFYVWSSATALGTDTNTLVAGSLGYKFDDALSIGGGVSALPSTRSLDGQFPFWHRVDARLIADEFMRGSFTQGVWANGRIAEGLDYKVMLGNNLSAFGVAAAQLDDKFDTWAASLIWMPTTGEFGPRANFGDYEYHEDLATLFSVHFTSSTEDKQSQATSEAPENTQIRLSDGATLFTPDLLAPGVTIDQLDYRMLALSAGLKYRGFYLEGEAYRRWLDDFRANGALPVDELTDDGFQLKASMMAVPDTLQVFVNGSKIWGEYGDPWDAGVGFNWWPFKKRGFRINGELVFINDSPVGAYSLPYPVGANGWLFVTSAEVAF